MHERITGNFESMFCLRKLSSVNSVADLLRTNSLIIIEAKIHF